MFFKCNYHENGPFNFEKIAEETRKKGKKEEEKEKKKRRKRKEREKEKKGRKKERKNFFLMNLRPRTKATPGDRERSEREIYRIFNGCSHI